MQKYDNFSYCLLPIAYCTSITCLYFETALEE